MTTFSANESSRYYGKTPTATALGCRDDCVARGPQKPNAATRKAYQKYRKCPTRLDSEPIPLATANDRKYFELIRPQNADAPEKIDVASRASQAVTQIIESS